jgi:hypothetical protein
MSMVLALIVLATGLAGCGNGEDRSKLLSATRASDLRSMLDEVEQEINNGDCESATNTALAFQQKVDALPARLNSSLRDALSAGANRLERLVEAQCEPAGTTGPTVQAPAPEEETPGKKGKAKGHNKKKHEEAPKETTPTVPDENLGITTP